MAELPKDKSSAPFRDGGADHGKNESASVGAWYLLGYFDFRPEYGHLRMVQRPFGSYHDLQR
jgi:hypothetical protein